MEDRDLVKRSQEGDEDAFGALVNKYKKKVFNLAFSLTRNPDVADDLAQEVFIKAYFALSKFRSQSKFGTWLYRITVNHTRDHLRKTARMRQVSFDRIENKAALEDDEMEKRKVFRLEEDRRRLVHETIKTLPEKHQVILSLRDIQGLSYDEIAQTLKISQGTVDSRLHRARKLLKKKLTPFLNQ